MIGTLEAGLIPAQTRAPARIASTSGANPLNSQKANINIPFSYDAGEQRPHTIEHTANQQHVTTYYPFPLYEEQIILVWREPEQCTILISPEGCWETWQTIQRAVYTLAGHAIATRVTTSPP